MIKLNEIYNMDCIDGMKLIDDNSVDLIIADIPYNVTNHDWDQFTNLHDYIDFLGDVFYEYNRILKQTGSIYIFHNDFIMLCEIQNLINNNTGFDFKQLIIWNKLFEGCKNKYLKDVSLCRGFLKNYVKFAEYILFYTFEEKRKVETPETLLDNFKNYKTYMQNILNKNQMTYISPEIVRPLYEKIGYKSMQGAKSISQRLFNFNFKNFGCITQKQYEVLNPILNFKKSYEEIRLLFNNDKRCAKQPEKTKRIHNTFNVLGSHHSVWNYNIPEDMIHPTQKPLELITNIILHSSNEGDVVLDSFCGSGTTIDSCINNNRNFIGFDNGKNKEGKFWADIIRERIDYKK